ncbi:CsbD family protein [Methylobacterium sp. E-005]|uniref:CsbD family protein n=1 Tax=Methylobacterium sp. E-005 TaxID=2836549 RepID=UPI001FBBB5AE|nr:CsbD family protein [Methylobacterium sp. E-005]MCJ2089932.1 CsbD family protein [Methylobacterium sp. E-005]
MVDTDRITGVAKELGGTVQRTVGDLAGSDRHAAEGRLREAQGAAETVYGQTRDSVRDAADAAYDFAEDAYERGGHSLRRGARGLGHQVAGDPLTALLIAGLVGFGLSLLVNATRD